MQAQLEGKMGDMETTLAQLQTLTPAEGQALAESIAARNAQPQTGRFACQALVNRYQARSDATPRLLKRLQWLMLPPTNRQGKEDWALGEAQYQAERLQSAYQKGDLAQVEHLLSLVPAEQMPSVQQAFDSRQDKRYIHIASASYAGNIRHQPLSDPRTLAQRIEHMPNNAQKQVFRLLLSPQPQNAIWQADLLSWRIDAALDGRNDVPKLREILLFSPGLPALAEERYDLHHPQERLGTRLRNELSDHAYGEIRHLLGRPEQQSQDWATWLHRAHAWTLVSAIDGMSTDQTLLIDTLTQAVQENRLSRLDIDFKALTGQTLKERLTPTGWNHWGPLSLLDEVYGRTRLRVEQLLEPRAQDAKQAAAQQVRWVSAQQSVENQLTLGDVMFNFVAPTHIAQKLMGAPGPLDRAEQLFRLDPGYETSGQRLRRTVLQAQVALQQSDFKSAQEYAGLSQRNMDSHTEVKDSAAVPIKAAAIGTAAFFTAGAATAVLPGMLYGAVAGAAAGGLSSFSLNPQAGRVVDDALTGGASGLIGGAWSIAPRAGRAASASAHRPQRVNPSH